LTDDTQEDTPVAKLIGIGVIPTAVSDVVSNLKILQSHYQDSKITACFVNKFIHISSNDGQFSRRGMSFFYPLPTEIIFLFFQPSFHHCSHVGISFKHVESQTLHLFPTLKQIRETKKKL